MWAIPSDDGSDVRVRADDPWVAGQQDGAKGMKPKGWATGIVLALLGWCAVVGIIVVLSGCGGFSGFRLPWSSSVGTAATAAAATVDPYAGLAWLGLLCIGVGVAGFVAGFVLPIIPKSTAGACVAAGIGLFVLKAFLVAFMGPLVWLLGLFALLFLAHLAYRLYLNWKGSRLAASGHFDAAGALQSMARGWTGKRHSEKRKELLVRVTNGHKPEPAQGTSN